MRIVLDTNVLISAALKADSIPALVIGAVEQLGDLLKSEATERQLFDVLARPNFATMVSAATVNRYRTLFASAALILITTRVAVCRDPTDDKFLELAVDGRANIIVSGDSDLLVLNPYRDIPIVTPAQFLRDLPLFA